MISKKLFLKLMNNEVFVKIMENVRKHRDIKLGTTEARRKYLLPEPNYYTAKLFSENLLALAMKETQLLVNKSVYLCLSTLELSKMAMLEFWYDCVKPMYRK